MRRMIHGAGAHMLAAQHSTMSHLADQEWPEPLRVLIPLVHASSEPMCVVWGENRLLFVNEACRMLSMFDQFGGVGKPLREAWPDLGPELEPVIERAFQGESARIEDISLTRQRRGYIEQTYLAFSFTPVRDDDGDVIATFGVCSDLTQRITEAGHAQLHNDLMDYLRELDDAETAMTSSADRLGRHLGVQAVGYAEISRDATCATITNDWAASGFGSVAGTYDLSDLSPVLAADLRAGKTLSFDRTDTEKLDPCLTALCRRSGARALIIAPSAKHGRLSGCLIVFSREPRNWTDVDVALVAEITKRIWAALHRIRVDSTLKESEARFRSVFENAAVGSGYTAPDGKFLMVNDQLCKITGYPRAELLQKRFPDVTHPYDHEADAEHIGRLLRGESEHYTREKRYIRKDGSIIWVNVSIACVRGPNGEVRHFVGFVKDISEQKQAEEALRESEQRLKHERAFLDAVIEAAPVGISIARDPMNEPPIINAVARRLTGIDEFAGDLERYAKLGAVHRDGRPYAPDDYPTARALKYGEELSDGEMIYRRGDECRRWLVNSRPLRDSEDKIIAAITAFADIEEQRRGEEHRKLLIAELNHRVKNTLAVVQALVQQTFRDGSPPNVARKALQDRLSALALTHDLLTRESWEKATLEQLAANAFESRGIEQERVSYGGPAILLQPKQAVTIAMALHELCTNAVKYGALSNETGTVAIDWTVSEGPEPQLRLVWQERNGPAVTQPKRRGFGSRMIERGLATELKGEVTMDFPAEGFVCIIEAPVPKGKEAAAA